MLISIYLVLSKYTKLNYQKTPSLSRNVIEIFCVSLYTDYLSIFHKTFQVASTHDANIECQIQIFCYILFFNFADKRLIGIQINHTHRHIQTHTRTHRPFGKNVFFGFRGPQNL